MQKHMTIIKKMSRSEKELQHDFGTVITEETVEEMKGNNVSPAKKQKINKTNNKTYFDVVSSYINDMNDYICLQEKNKTANEQEIFSIGKDLSLFEKGTV
ncbi:hypothetical protein RFI_08298 [Reticulomyxa filosa]|uniref:Uncharacterized protein n=1 Tax=Reticulomyxa filosa TaxID=46433 RepID=X6NU83_RETFI|nr:hypothetical protein RFI_08298 [Reticulomyxa filosa]|eukprot:ETO28827.1 hypothetical protein RFI_08298 [Reticulomyxa filosa]